MDKKREGGFGVSEQTTIKKEFSYSGVALHSGEEVRLKIKPAPANSGICFLRTDLPGSPQIPATWEYAHESSRCTTLQKDGVRVRTPEHLLAALAGLGVDNVTLELSGEEVPMADGSAQTWVELICASGIVPLAQDRCVRQLTGPVWVEAGERLLVALPASSLTISYLFTNPHPAIGTQFAQFTIEPDTFATEVAPSRTLAFLEEVEALRRQGLGLGGNMDVAVVLGKEGFVGKLRFPDEVVRHKILDLVGDLSLAGPLAAHIIGLRSGHALNARLVKAIVANSIIA